MQTLGQCIDAVGSVTWLVGRTVHAHARAHTVLMAIFPGELGLAGCPLNSPPFILELCILLGQT